MIEVASGILLAVAVLVGLWLLFTNLRLFGVLAGVVFFVGVVVANLFAG